MTAIEAETSLPRPATTVEHVLTLDCRESPGIVHAVSGFLLEHGCDIIDNQQFGDAPRGTSSCGCTSRPTARRFSTEDTLRRDFAPVAERWR